MTKSVALQYAPLGVRVNAGCPGTIATPMVDRMSAAEERRIHVASTGQIKELLELNLRNHWVRSRRFPSEPE